MNKNINNFFFNGRDAKEVFDEARNTANDAVSKVDISEYGPRSSYDQKDRNVIYIKGSDLLCDMSLTDKFIIELRNMHIGKMLYGTRIDVQKINYNDINGSNDESYYQNLRAVFTISFMSVLKSYGIHCSGISIKLKNKKGN